MKRGSPPAKNAVVKRRDEGEAGKLVLSRSGSGTMWLQCLEYWICEFTAVGFGM